MSSNPITARRHLLSLMEVSVADGEEHYSTVSVKPFYDAISSDYGHVTLRLFVAGDLTRRVLTRLDHAAARLLDPAQETLQILRASRSTYANQHQLWFAIEAGQRVHAVPASDVSDRLKATADRKSSHDMLFALTTPDLEVDVASLLSSLRNSMQLDLPPATRMSSATGRGLTEPEVSPETMAASFRRKLHPRRWPTSVQVGRLYGGNVANPSQWAAERRAAGELFGVWFANEGIFRYPTFQFVERALHPRVKELLTTMAVIPGMYPEEDCDGWRRAFWMESIFHSICDEDGQAVFMSDLFATDPDNVIDLALREAKFVKRRRAARC